MSYGSKEVSIRFPGFGDGMNSQDPPVKVGEAYRGATRLQCSSSKNAILKGSSIKRRPGMRGIIDDLSTWIRGLDTYLQQDGTDGLLTVIGGDLYLVNKTTGATTFLYTLGGGGEAWFATYQNKCFISNGAKNIKLENITAYQVGIEAPTGITAEAYDGGVLAPGVYQIYVCYARKVSGTIVLYSTGQNLGTITLVNGVSNAIRLNNFADSTDPQVTTKVVFMSDADGSTYYFYRSVDSGTQISISTDYEKNEAIVYDAVAAGNIVPPAFSQILAADNRLWGVSGNTVYYSLQSGTAYDLERWTELNFITYPYLITSIHALGQHLYINTPAGLIRQPFFDVSARFEHVEKRYYFKYPRTVAEWSGTLIGLTEDGVRIFDGEKMSSYDVSLDVKPEIEIAYNGASNENKPCGAVYRRSYRTEYHLGYRDLSVGNATNNSRLVLNLDRFAVAADNTVIAPWEKWDAGANYLTVDSNGQMFAGQSAPANSVIYVETDTRAADTDIYKGDILTAESIPALQVVTGVYIMSLSAKVRWTDIRMLAQLAENMTVEAHILTYPAVQTVQTVQPLTATTDVARFGIARFGVDRFAPATPTHKIAKLPRSINGYAVYFVINQVLEDKKFEVLQMEATGVLTASRFT
ncbi:conserved hypothetical protein [Gammaproteobacteria bacterium]